MKKRVKEILILLLGGFLIISWSYILFLSSITLEGLSGEETSAQYQTTIYGIPADSSQVYFGEVKPNQVLSDILIPLGVEARIIYSLVERSEGVFNVRRIRAGNSFAVIYSDDSLKKPTHFIYEINLINYLVFDLRDTLHIREGQKLISLRTDTATGLIHSSLWNALANEDQGIELALAMEDIYGWSVDFFALKKGDHFKVLYDKMEVEGKAAGIGKIHSAVFNHHGVDYYAFRFQADSASKPDYFDEKGQSLRREFLKAPLKYSRISSRFSGSRFHPVLKIYRPHHGVDYAAPTGTPVHSIGDGTVVGKGYTGGYGHTVKIRHNSLYTTQYAHLSGYAKGISTGSRVKQGQVIGYVGSTGLSSGPHLDFRFYKAGHPVNPLKVESPPAMPVPSNYMAGFLENALNEKYRLEHIKNKSFKDIGMQWPLGIRFNIWPFTESN